MQENDSDKKSFTILGKYIPVNKTSFQKQQSGNVTNPISNESLKLNIYEGDYLQKKYCEDFKIKPSSNIFQVLFVCIKYFFFNLPLINILYMKYKKAEIQKTINDLNVMSINIDKYTSFLKDSSIASAAKYKKFSINKKDFINTKNNKNNIQKNIFNKIL
ncbi:hypothetical protein IJG14_01790 [bacterium]|nr:hypothetical protein [bacterium]